jgi:AcrR family transcriptional regulator
VNDIVDAAGVAKGSFFNHFVDKDGFAAAIAAKIRAEVEAKIAEANAGVTDPAARVAGGVSSFVAFALADPRSAKIMLRGHDRALGADHPLNAGVRADVALGVSSGRFRPLSLQAGVLYVVGVCQMLLAAVIMEQMDTVAARLATEELLVLLLTGLGLAEAEARSISAKAVETLGAA